MEEKYSFKDFLMKDTYIGVDSNTEEEITGVIAKIEIPMIQRDYAQGRIKEYKNSNAIINDTGSRFLRSLFKSLKANEPVELEFIYGSVEERPIPRSKDKEYVYIPLDGQQRLTTLFLLYWYIGMRELTEQEDKVNLLQLIGKFTYLTRTSSRVFCESICDSTKIGGITIGADKPSKQIENCSWYYKEYKKDPTVKAMLVMLDYIDSLYNTENTEGASYLPRLENLRFYAFPLNKYKLTEDLYIKMNARGKQLSGYENFKADLINWMKSKSNPETAKFMEEVEYRGRKMKYYMAFAQKLDNEWTDIFWNAIRNSASSNATIEGKTIDRMFMRFFIRYFFNYRILWLQKHTEIADENIANDNIVKYFYGEKGDDANVTYNNNDFEDKYLLCLSYDSVSAIERFLDGIQDKLEIVNEVFIPSWQNEKKSLDSSFYYPKINWAQRTVFLAVFNYFTKNNKFEEQAFKDWTRIVWNFVVDPSIRNIKDSIGTLKFIDDLSQKSNDIISYLASTSETSRFKAQFAEEHIKALLVEKENQWRDLLIKGESHFRLKGRILCLLPEKEETNIETFKKFYEVACLIIPTYKWEFLWIRAILSQIDNYDMSTGSLSLSDERENWKVSINDNLMLPFQLLINNIIDHSEEIGDLTKESVSKYMHDELCLNYESKEGIEWICPLVKWEDNYTSLLYSCSDSKKIDFRYGKAFLCYKTTLSPESSILLSGFRDRIISAVLPNTEGKFEWIYTSYKCNICDTFFRGFKVTLFRNIELNNYGFIKASYIFDIETNCITVGIRRADNPDKEFDDAPETWICSKIYDMSEVQQESDIKTFVDKIESEVFDFASTESLLSKADNKEWYNDYEEIIPEAITSSSGLTITYPDGSIISNNIAVKAYIDALKKIGLEEVSMKGIIRKAKVGELEKEYNIVGKEKRPGNNWQQEIDGWYVYTNLSNEDKKNYLEQLCPGIKVEDGVK